MPDRVKVYDGHAEARRMREVFVDRPVEQEVAYRMSWPSSMQNVGDSIAVAYHSDKWKPKNRSGKRSLEAYKHLAESRNRCLAVPGVLVDYHTGRPIQVFGPQVSLAGSVTMPRTFAMLGLFEELALVLHVGQRGSEGLFGEHEDDGVVHVAVRHAYLGGGVMRQKSGKEPFLFVFTKSHGVMFLVVGDELAIERDGIVG